MLISMVLVLCSVLSVLVNCRLMFGVHFLLLSLAIMLTCRFWMLLDWVVLIIGGIGVLTEAELNGLRLVTILRSRVVLRMAWV